MVRHHHGLPYHSVPSLSSIEAEYIFVCHHHGLPYHLVQGVLYYSGIELMYCLRLYRYLVCYFVSYQTIYRHCNRMVPVWDLVLKWWTLVTMFVILIYPFFLNFYHHVVVIFMNLLWHRGNEVSLRELGRERWFRKIDYYI